MVVEVYRLVRVCVPIDWVEYWMFSTIPRWHFHSFQWRKMICDVGVLGYEPA